MSAGSFSQLYIQLVFAVKYRRNSISFDWDDDLYKYITGIVKKQGQLLLAINGMPDHVHIFIRMRPSCCISDLVREIKKASNAWINENNLVPGKFEWQGGYGAFSYSHSSAENVIKYIWRQKEHHLKRKFKDEYIDLLKEFDIEYKDEYLFQWTMEEDE